MLTANFTRVCIVEPTRYMIYDSASTSPTLEIIHHPTNVQDRVPMNVVTVTRIGLGCEKD